MKSLTRLRAAEACDVVPIPCVPLMGITTVWEAAGLGTALLVVPIGTALPLHSRACGVACITRSLSSHTAMARKEKWLLLPMP